MAIELYLKAGTESEQEQTNDQALQHRMIHSKYA